MLFFLDCMQALCFQISSSFQMLELNVLPARSLVEVWCVVCNKAENNQGVSVHVLFSHMRGLQTSAFKYVLNNHEKCNIPYFQDCLCTLEIVKL